MHRNMAETVMGGVVLLVAAVFVYLFVGATQVKSTQGYKVTATFSKVGGVLPGADVSVSGIAVGSVAAVTLDPKTYLAVVTLAIKPEVKLPRDSIATISSSGLIGGNYIRIKPGNTTDYLADGQAIEKSEDFKTLEDQVGEIIFLATGGSGGGSSDAGFK
jgi:phospholipid/cholesterol/gamma-HCH transport system substrate-binding protein